MVRLWFTNSPDSRFTSMTSSARLLDALDDLAIQASGYIRDDLVDETRSVHLQHLNQNSANSGSRSISSETHSYNENDHLLPLYRQRGPLRSNLFLRLMELLSSMSVDGTSAWAISFRLFVIALVALSGLFVWKLDICNGWIE